MSAPRCALAGASFFAAAALLPAAATASPPSALQAGQYAGRTTADAAGKPRAVAWTVKKTGCGATARAGYCLVFDPESFIEGKCSLNGYMYNAFVPVTTPIELPASGRIDHSYTLYVANGEVQLTPGGGAVPSGKFQLSLRFDTEGRVTGSERVTVDLREGDGVCDTGLVKITASHG